MTENHFVDCRENDWGESGPFWGEMDSGFTRCECWTKVWRSREDVLEAFAFLGPDCDESTATIPAPHWPPLFCCLSAHYFLFPSWICCVCVIFNVCVVVVWGSYVWNLSFLFNVSSFMCAQVTVKRIGRRINGRKPRAWRRSWRCQSAQIHWESPSQSNARTVAWVPPRAKLQSKTKPSSAHWVSLILYQDRKTHRSCSTEK